MFVRMIVVAGALTLASMAESHAAIATVDVDGVFYDVSSIYSTFDALTVQLTTQIWWNDGALAFKFATQTSDQLGLGPNGIGPLFLYAGGNAFYYNGNDGHVFGASGVPSNEDFAFATASPTSSTTPVPIPATGMLLLTVLGGALALKRWKRHAA